MKILFICHAKSNSVANNAYTHRVMQLERMSRQLGIETGVLFLQDYLVASPALLQPVNAPWILKRVNKFDVIHSAGNGPAYVLGFLKRFTRGRPLIVYDVHGDINEESLLKRRTRDSGLMSDFLWLQDHLMERVAVRSSDCFVVASRRLRSRLLERGIDDDRIEVILNGVDLDFFAPEHVMRSPFFTVTYAGSFRPWQGIDVLVEAAEALPEDARLRIVGFRDQDSRLKNKIRRKLGSRVELVDWVPRNELKDLLRKSDVLIIPRIHHEVSAAFPTKFGEFVALGKPVIVTSIDETSELVEEYDCGFVCEPTVESIATTMRLAKDTPRDVLDRKGANARRLAETELDLDRIGEKYAAFLLRMVSRQRALPSS